MNNSLHVLYMLVPLLSTFHFDPHYAHRTGHKFFNQKWSLFLHLLNLDLATGLALANGHSQN